MDAKSHKDSTNNSADISGNISANISANTSTPQRAQVASTLPDVSLELKPEFYGCLSRVGMREIQMPVRLRVGGEDVRLAGSLAAFVSLDDPEAKGIHMSRLYLELQEVLTHESVDVQVMQRILRQFIASHQGISRTAALEIRVELPLKRSALVSELSGYRQYPVTLKGELIGDEFSFSLESEILYSSTCPCSAALARGLAREEFRRRFAGQSQVSAEDVEAWLTASSTALPVPHAQRSLARVCVKMDTAKLLTPKYTGSVDFVREHIDLLEAAVGTPVQTAVKRIDEQEFARLNGENLMFCEDAARKLRAALEADSFVCEYDIYVEHQESLHPHNAVSRVSGVKPTRK